MALHVLVLGAGFGGLELTTILSEKLGDDLDLILIDKNDSFFFGFSKLDIMFGKKEPDEVLVPYALLEKPGVRFVCDTITTIDPQTRTVTTEHAVFTADVLVVALGADYDLNATPGLVEGGYEYYSFDGAIELRTVLPTFTSGHAMIGICGVPWKCPPAPMEGILLLHDFLVSQGVREQCKLSLLMPYPVPIPPSPDASAALMKSFVEKDIHFIPEKTIARLNPSQKVAICTDGTELTYDLFIGIPVHVPPKVVMESGLVENGWIPVDRNLRTKFSNVYSVGDVTSIGTPKAGVFAEGSAVIAAESIIADYRKGNRPDQYAGLGMCYIEFGGNIVGQVNVDVFGGPKPVGTLVEASEVLVQEKLEFGKSRLRKWFGIR